jgi:hypothetical protein
MDTCSFQPVDEPRAPGISVFSFVYYPVHIDEKGFLYCHHACTFHEMFPSLLAFSFFTRPRVPAAPVFECN